MTPEHDGIIGVCEKAFDGQFAYLLPSSSLWLFVRSFLGLLLLTAVVLKVRDHTYLPPQHTLRWLDRPSILFPLTGAELTVSALLLSGLWAPSTRKIAIAAFGVLGCAAAAEILMGAKSCGCFGNVEVPPWYTAGFDICAVVGLLLCKRPTMVTRHNCFVQRVAFAVAIVLAGVATPAVLELYHPGVVTTGLIAARENDLFGAPRSFVVLEPSVWASGPFTLASHIDAGPRLRTGRWIVMLVRHDCDHCIAAVPKFETFAATHPDSKLAIIEMPPYAQPGEELPITPDVSLTGKLDTSRDWFATTPVAIYLRGGIVQSAVDGDKAATPDPSWK
jgi:hypothetical protein